jgi:S-adenosylmethionine synthetase
MLEKVNKYHPDKVADRIAGAIVDYAYTLNDNPKIAVEVLVGHGRATVIAESSVVLRDESVTDIVQRFVDVDPWDIDFTQVPQDPHLSGAASHGRRP